MKTCLITKNIKYRSKTYGSLYIHTDLFRLFFFQITPDQNFSMILRDPYFYSF